VGYVGAFEGAVKLAARQAVAGIVHLTCKYQVGMLIMDAGVADYVQSVQNIPLFITCFAGRFEEGRDSVNCLAALAKEWKWIPDAAPG
jgi:hypothetical protein